MAISAAMINQLITITLISLLVAVGIFAAVIGGYFLYRFLRYKIEVKHYEFVNGQVIGGKGDLAREVYSQTERGSNVRKTYLQLFWGFKNKKKIPIPSGSQFISFGRRKFLQIVWIDGIPYPLKISTVPKTENSNLTYDPNDVIKVMLTDENISKTNAELHQPDKKSFMEQYGVYMMFILFAIVQIITVIITVKQGGGGGTTAVSQLIK